MLSLCLAMAIILRPVTQSIPSAHFRFVYLSFVTVMIMMVTTFVQPSLSEVHRLYSPTSKNGYSVACADDRVIMTCRATGSRLTWTTISNLRGRVVFVNTDPVWTVISQDTITGILLQNDPSDNNLRTFVSELHVYATRSSQAVNVTCSSDSGSSSHIISPPVLPEPPIFKSQCVLLTQSNTISQYYLEWEPPINQGDTNLDHYELYIGENLIQKVHPEQRYAVINVHNGFTTVVRLTAIDKCGQMSNYSHISIVPMSHSDFENETSTTSTVDYTTVTAGDSTNRGISSITVGVVLSCFIALLMLVSGGILCTVYIMICHRKPLSISNLRKVSAKNSMFTKDLVEHEANSAAV